MKCLAVLVLLAGCPAPPAPAPDRPPPPVIAPDAAPAPTAPAVLAARLADDRFELVRLDATGDARVLHELWRKAALPNVADLAFDAASGRYALLVEADAVDDTDLATPRDVMSLVLGAITDDALVAAGVADKACVMHKCFESEVALAPGGDAVVTTEHRSGSSDLVAYAFGATPSPTQVATKVERPTLSADHTRVAFLRGGTIYVGDVGAKSPAAVATGVKDVVAMVLGDGQVAYRTGKGAVVLVDVETQVTRNAPALGADPQPVLRLVGSTLFSTDGGNVVAVRRGDAAWHAVTPGALVDVSADGAWVLAHDDALTVVAAADGEVWARHDVKFAFGEVHARLAP